MSKKLEREFLSADLVAVEEILATYSECQDPIGFWQFTERKKEIEQRLLQVTADIARDIEIEAAVPGTGRR